MFLKEVTRRYDMTSEKFIVRSCFKGRVLWDIVRIYIQLGMQLVCVISFDISTKSVYIYFFGLIGLSWTGSCIVHAYPPPPIAFVGRSIGVSEGKWREVLFDDPKLLRIMRMDSLLFHKLQDPCKLWRFWKKYRRRERSDMWHAWSAAVWKSSVVLRMLSRDDASTVCVSIDNVSMKIAGKEGPPRRSWLFKRPLVRLMAREIISFRKMIKRAGRIKIVFRTTSLRNLSISQHLGRQGRSVSSPHRRNERIPTDHCILFHLSLHSFPFQICRSRFPRNSFVQDRFLMTW